MAVQRAGLSRRELLKRAGLVGVAAAVPAGIVAPEAAPVRELEARESFTAAEADTVQAVVSRLIPTDSSGPGAVEARVARYIDRALKADLADQADAYAAGLAALDAYSNATHGSRFRDLGTAQQDAVLTNMEANVAPGFSPDSRTFFNLVREHAIQGMFSDPYYGGNADGAGWKLLGFPGIKLDVPERDQRLDVAPAEPGEESTYDFVLFRPKGTKGGGRAGH